MNEKNKDQPQVSIGEQLLLFSLTIIGGIVISWVGAPDKWLTALFCTIPTFAGMISYFRKKMPTNVLWITLACAFPFHLLLLWVVFGFILRQQDDVGLVVCLPGIFAEGFILYHGVNFIRGKMAG